MLLGFCTGRFAHAADPQPYKVEIASAGDRTVDSTLKASSDLEALRTTAPVSPLGLIARSRGDIDRLKTVMESFGYYQSTVVVKIDGTALDDPHLGDTLASMSKDRDARVTIELTRGPLYHLRKIEISGDMPEAIRAVLELSPGDPAVAAAVLAGGARMLVALEERGYAFAKVDTPIAYEDPKLPLLDVTFHVVAGVSVNIGEIRVEGMHQVRERVVRDRLMLRRGDLYSPSKIERGRQDILGLGVFSAVSIDVGTAVDASGGVPITFKVRERLRHAASVNAAYSSDLGGSGGVSWTDRDLSGHADPLNLSASAINIGGSATTGLGYDTSAKYSLPDFGRRDQSLQLSLGATKQFLQAYDQQSVSTALTLDRKLSKTWSVTFGLSASREHIVQQDLTLVGEDPAREYTLVAIPMSLIYDSTNLASPLDDPHHGIRASLSVAPTRALGNPNANYIIGQFKFAQYFDLHGLLKVDRGRSVLAIRALAGLADGAGEFSLPPDQRFYGGGSGTIRGYRYQAVGPRFPDGNPIGGTAITAGGVEFRQRFGENFGAAVFADAGQVSASLKALPNEFRIGVGIGMRYYTPIGPIRLDVAVPTQRSVTDDHFEIYIGLGQAF